MASFYPTQFIQILTDKKSLFMSVRVCVSTMECVRRTISRNTQVVGLEGSIYGTRD